MGFFDFLTGGNTKVAAKSIALAHRRNGGDYQATLNEITKRIEDDIFSEMSPQRSVNLLLAVSSVRNYTDLGCAYLYVCASPKFAVWNDIRTSFSPKMASFLRAEGIPESYISGFNERIRP